MNEKPCGYQPGHAAHVWTSAGPLGETSHCPGHRDLPPLPDPIDCPMALDEYVMPQPEPDPEAAARFQNWLKQVKRAAAAPDYRQEWKP